VRILGLSGGVRVLHGTLGVVAVEV